MIEHQEAARGTLKTYLAGYVLSFGLTITAYLSLRHHIGTHHAFPTDNIMLAILASLAIAQLMAQLVFFLHLNRESKPRLNFLVFSFMLIVLVIVVGGSLWIMNNLNYHMTSQQMSQYLKNQESGGL
jgi:cytochrome o ubiquinol oxidase subunit IV